MAMYRHHDLRTSTSIRLVSILAERHDGEVTLSLQDVSLADAEKLGYKAISYTWGPAEPSRRVWIDGSWMELRWNVSQFLEHEFATAYDLYQPPVYWIDSICINQENIPEKASQVAMMGEIFRKAQAVYIWLDEASKQEALVLEFKGRCARWIEQGSAWGKPEYGLVAWEVFAEEFSCNIGGQLKEEVFDEVKVIAGHEYWQRLWTLQEILLGRSVYIILSDTIVELEAFHHLRKVATTQAYGSFPQPEEYVYEPRWSSLNHTLNYLGQSRQYQYPPEKRNWPLEGLLSASAVKQCSIVHDKIYGLIGMCDTLKGFEVDYSCSVRDLLKRTSICLKNEATRLQTRRNDAAKIQLGDLCHTLSIDVSSIVAILELSELAVEISKDLDEDEALTDYRYVYVIDGRRYIDSGSAKTPA